MARPISGFRGYDASRELSSISVVFREIPLNFAISHLLINFPNMFCSLSVFQLVFILKNDITVYAMYWQHRSQTSRTRPSIEFGAILYKLWSGKSSLHCQELADCELSTFL